MSKKNANSSQQSGLLMLRQEKKEEGVKSPEEMKKVVMHGAKLMCPFHPAPGTLLVTSNQVRLQGTIWATETDNQKPNFLFPGICTHPSVASSPPPCLSIITPIKWMDVGTILVQGNKTLLKKSKIKCAISGQDITIIHDGQTVAPSVMMNLGQDVVIGSSPDFNCPPEVKAALDIKVHTECDKMKTSCKGTDSCSVLEIKIAQTNSCIAARRKIMIECYRGGDQRHHDQINERLRSLADCSQKYFKNCNDKEPAPAPVPLPVPLPAPVPQEDEDFMKKMEEITGLAGVALIIYLIISEVSRLFLPRNLIPVP